MRVDAKLDSESAVTDERGEGGLADDADDTFDEFEPSDVGPTSSVHELGLEARAEFERLRMSFNLDDDPVPLTIDRYRIESVLGRGGMGVVFLAHDPGLERSLAIKLVHTGPLVDHERLEARLEREARVLARLSHPNVVKVYEVGTHEGQHFVAMEHVAGTNLRVWLDADERTNEAILAAYLQAARGLAAVHQAGIVHRDFKPDNVLIDREGRVAVGDFGLADAHDLVPANEPSEAGLARATAHLTRTGALVGTLRYMAPERLRGEPASFASDQFEFCTALWEALTGARPFAGDTRESLLRSMLGPTSGGERLERRIRSVLERGLAREAGLRYPSLDALIAELDPPTPPWRAITAIGLAAVVGLVIGKVWIDPPELPACALRDQLDALEQRPLELPAGTSTSARAAVEAELAQSIAPLRADVERACLDPGEQAEALRWVEVLDAIVEHADEIEVARTLDSLANFEFERDRMPPALHDPELAGLLDRARTDILAGELERAEQTTEQAGERARSRADLAEITLRRGQLARWRGRPAAALELYAAGLRHAEVARLDQTRLALHLLATDVALRSARDFERAAAHHQSAGDLIERLELPPTSSLRVDHLQHEALFAANADEDLTRALSLQAEVIALREAEGNPRLLAEAIKTRAVFHQLRGDSHAGGAQDYALALADYRRVLAELDRLDVGPRDPLRLAALYNVALVLWSGEPTLAEFDEIDANLATVIDAGPSGLRMPALQLAAVRALDLAVLEPTPDHHAALRELEVSLAASLAVDDLPPRDRIDGWVFLALIEARVGDLPKLELADAQVLGLGAEAVEQGSLSSSAADMLLAGHAMQVCVALADHHPSHAARYLERARQHVASLPAEANDDPVVVALAETIDRVAAQLAP